MPRRSTVAGMVGSVVTAAIYLPGSGRAFDYDGSVTVATFVRTSSLVDPFRHQVVFNNHPAFSFLEHLVYSVTGSASSWTLRLLPIGAAALCVGLVVSLAWQRLGWQVGAGAGALLASNPVFLATSREVRGYSLVCLCAVAATALLLDLERSPSRPKSVAYVGVAALGLATHLYMAPVLVGHVALLAVRRRLTVEWRTRWLIVGTLGLISYSGLIAQMAKTSRGRVFQPWFLPSLVGSLLGGTPLVGAVVGAGVAVTLGRMRSRREAKVLAAMYLVIVVVVWMMAPRDLYPRFFVWVVPGVALAAAAGLASIRLSALVIVALPLALVPSLHDYTGDALANRVAAPYLAAVQGRGGLACGIGFATQTLAAYVEGVNQVVRVDQLTACDIAVAVEPSDDPKLVAEAQRIYPHQRRLRARTVGLLLWR